MMMSHGLVTRRLIWAIIRLNRKSSNIGTAYTYIVQISQHERRKLMSNNQLLICYKSNLYFELGNIVTRREIKMNKLEPKSLVGGIYPPYPPPGSATDSISCYGRIPWMSVL